MAPLTKEYQGPPECHCSWWTSMGTAGKVTTVIITFLGLGYLVKAWKCGRPAAEGHEGEAS